MPLGCTFKVGNAILNAKVLTLSQKKHIENRNNLIINLEKIPKWATLFKVSGNETSIAVENYFCSFSLQDLDMGVQLQWASGSNATKFGIAAKYQQDRNTTFRVSLFKPQYPTLIRWKDCSQQFSYWSLRKDTSQGLKISHCMSV